MFDVLSRTLSKGQTSRHGYIYLLIWTVGDSSAHRMDVQEDA